MVRSQLTYIGQVRLQKRSGLSRPIWGWPVGGISAKRSKRAHEWRVFKEYCWLVGRDPKLRPFGFIRADCPPGTDNPPWCRCGPPAYARRNPLADGSGRISDNLGA
jgi:hypothetical protein